MNIEDLKELRAAVDSAIAYLEVGAPMLPLSEKDLNAVTGWPPHRYDLVLQGKFCIDLRRKFDPFPLSLTEFPEHGR